MNEIYGKQCPYCKSELKQGEDIIVCSECNMPHHKECWIENKGCTTFGCLGTIDTPKETVNNDFELTLDDFDMVRCNICGTLSSKDNQYCNHCGGLLYSDSNNAYVKNQIPMENIGVDYYSEVFKKITYDNDWLQWNWSAFVFSHYWLIYKRVYLYGISIFIANMILVLISIPLYIFIAVILHIILGAIGNMLYYNSVCKQGVYKYFGTENHNNITAIVCLAVVFVMIVAGKIQR